MCEEINESGSEVLCDASEESANAVENEGASESTDEAASGFENITEKLNSLEIMFKKRLLYDEGKEKIIDKLHAELQDYKQDIYFKLTRPIFFDIAVEIDAIRKMMTATSTADAEKIVSKLDSIAESLICLLDKYEVHPFSSEANTPFNAAKHRVAGTVDTKDDSLNGLIAESVFSGFEHKGQLISPEKVMVYKKQEIVEDK